MEKKVQIRIIRASAFIGFPIAYWFGWQAGAIAVLGVWGAGLLYLAPMFIEGFETTQKLMEQLNERLEENSEFQRCLVERLVDEGILSIDDDSANGDDEHIDEGYRH